MRLSKRLKAIHDHIPANAILADIGTDHGLLMIQAIQSGQAQKAYGLDINADPLQQAHDNVVRFSMEDKIELILSDGLKSFNQTADTFVLAGMGAETIWSIIDAYTFQENDTLIIQSNTKHYWLRQTLNQNGFSITKELFLMDQGKPVFIQIAKLKKSDPLSPCEKHLGAYLIKSMTPEYHHYLQERSIYLKTIKHNNTFLEEEYHCILKHIEKGATHE